MTTGLQAIGHHYGPFTQKLLIPRQSLVVSAESRIVLTPKQTPESVLKLETFSHIWLLFRFQNAPASSSGTVRPPRLRGGSVGVFASRAPYRPNSIGLSLVRLLSVDFPTIHITGADLLDGTEIVDIKPYLATDRAEDPSFGWVDQNPEKQLPVEFSTQSSKALTTHAADRQVILESLAQDPRSAWDRAKVNDSKLWKTRYGRWDVHWRRCRDRIMVDEVIPVEH